MEHKDPKFTLVRTDLLQEAVVVLSESILIGRLRECELLLNHPRVSRVQAGIRVIEGNYYVFNLRKSNPVHLNGKPILENDCLAAGDRLAIGPFLLDVDLNNKGLVLEVSLQIGISYEAFDAADPAADTEKADAKTKKPAPLPADKALHVFWEKRMREAGKIVRPSPLFPTTQRRVGKAQSYWISTTDLSRRWPVSFFIWGTIVAGVAVIGFACWYAPAYAPAAVSRVHAQRELKMSPPIAQRASGNSCTTCHSLTIKMATQCANCHHTEAFESTIIKPHRDAGISCVNCHPEHRGADLRAAGAAVLACTQCHNNANKHTYNGQSVSTPHGGKFGYPVSDEGKWVWKGIDDTEWAQKKIKVTRLPMQSDEEWLSTEFHAIHVLRVRAVPGIQGDAQGLLWCNSCHEPVNPPSRSTPRTKCGLCHNGRVEDQIGGVSIAADQPNCTSCHMQHVLDKRNFYSEAD